MKISKQSRRGAKELFRSTFVNGAMDESRVRAVVQRVLETKPRGYLPMLAHFERLVKLEIARRTAKVESALPLDPALQSSVQQKLNQIYGAGLNISYAQNPALIGGLRIQVGSDVYDGSVQARLNDLRENF
ncbi:MAG: F0F1 ATP synthase subunit delta [Verrucomicrobiota bacterium]|jgi:F-type H+-transporting ATPase subunit delta